MKLSISENISRLRKSRLMTQEQLAEALGVTFAAVSKWERGVTNPELCYIVEMADLFGVSVDVLLGYQMRSNSVDSMTKRVRELQKEKDYDVAVIEAEKALVSYPNSFGLVHRCGKMYMAKGIETNDMPAVARAVELFNHSILLLSENTDTQISESSIQTEIAQCYLVLGNKESGIELLKRNNIGGVHNALIGLTYATSDIYRPDDAAPYLSDAFIDTITMLIRLMTGYSNYFFRTNNPAAASESILWLAHYLESVKSSDTTVSFVDKALAPLYAECAHLCEVLGNVDDIEPYFLKALRIARAFDANPNYSRRGIKFNIGKVESSIMYDEIGATVMGAIDQQVQRDDWSDQLREIWNNVKTQN